MNQELYQYLVPDVAEWLIKNIIQQHTLLSEFIKLDTDETILYISSDFQFMYTFIKDEIRKYDLRKENYIVMTNVEGSYIMQSLQHPQWIGIFNETFQNLFLIDVTTGETLHIWKVNSVFHDYFYSWDEELGLLISELHISPTTTEPVIVTFNDLKFITPEKVSDKIIYHYTCFFLNKENVTLGISFNVRKELDYIQKKETRLHKNILHVFHISDEEGIKYHCPHIINHYTSDDCDIWIQNNFRMVNINSRLYSIVQYLDNAITTRTKTCNCK